MMNNQQYPYPAAQQFVAPIQPSGNATALKIVLGIVGGMIGLLLGLLVLLLIGVETGPVALVVGIICAVLPVPIYVTLVLWIDRYESEPIWMLCTAFCWGALVAVFIAFIFNTAGVVSVALMTQSEQAAETAGAVIFAPFVEESAKASILFVLFFAKRDEFDGVVDGVVYAAMVALGFAMTENIQYYGKAVLQGGGVLTATFILRGFLAPFSHPLFTSMTGVGLGLARQSTNTAIKIITPILGLFMAIAMHAIWNGSAVLGGGPLFLITYVLFMVPAFLVLLVVIIFALRREGRIVREYLLPDYQRGLLTAAEYEQLCSIWKRMGSSISALTSGGFQKCRTSMRFNQMGSELAFHRNRVARGIFRSPEAAQQREVAFLQGLQELLQRLRTG